MARPFRQIRSVASPLLPKYPIGDGKLRSLPKKIWNWRPIEDENAAEPDSCACLGWPVAGISELMRGT